MITGLGIDIIEVSRIAGLMSKGKEVFLNVVYTASESEFALKQENPAMILAVMFSAKEAFVKALGTGFTGKLDFRQIDVQYRGEQNPGLVIKGEAGRLIEKKKVISTHLSVAFTNNIALAVVILEN